MNRCWLVLPVLCGVFAVGSQAEDVPEPPSAAEQAQQFHRNRELIETLVMSGLALAEQKTRLDRTVSCNDLAKKLADEMRRATRSREGYRAAELGKHLYSLLNDGVARNLKESARHIPEGSPGVQELQRIQQGVRELLKPLRDDLNNLAAPGDREQIQQALDAIGAGGAAVDQAVPPQLARTKSPAQAKSD
jgi:hypothetical protein